MFKHLFFFLLLPIAVIAQKDTLGNQTNNQADFQAHVKKALTPIKIDGVLDETDWLNAQIAKDFWQKYPDNKEHAKTKTEARLTYDDHFLYIGFVCHDSSAKHVIPTLKRDINYFDGDGIAVLLDPVNQKSNGYMFGVSPLGVQSETTIESFGEPSWSWDNKWYAEVKQYADKWTVEIAIPFKTLRYEAGKTTWGINFVRNDIKHGQYHTWARVPLQFDGFSLGFYGALLWDAPPPVEKGNVVLIPYLLAGASKDFETGDKTDKILRGGVDAKIALNSQLNLDATINPDFSQVDVDEQVANLTRFDISYPEKRTFFLENSDVLAELGTPFSRPFFSRRIGLDADAQRVPINFGLRLSGNLNKGTRINVFNMQTGTTPEQAAQNYTAAVVQQTIVGRSFFKVGFLNRQGFSDSKIDKTEYKRNLAGELSYTSKNNQLDAWALYHHSIQPNIETNNSFKNVGFWYHPGKFQFLSLYETIGANYETGMDFIPRLNNYDALRDTTLRLGYKFNYNSANYRIIPKNSTLIGQSQIEINSVMTWNADNSLNNRNLQIGYSSYFKNTAEISLSLNNEDSRLPVHTAFTDYTPLPPAQYVFTNVSAEYATDKRKNLNFNARFTVGEFYNGKQLAMAVGMTYRRIPFGVFSLRFERYDLQFPQPYGQSLLYLINNKTELSFNKNLIWTTFLQYNTQADNFNINSRLQWRYKPMSDLFIVYSDNYGTQPFIKRNRALVLKMNYWFNL